MEDCYVSIKKLDDKEMRDETTQDLDIDSSIKVNPTNYKLNLLSFYFYYNQYFVLTFIYIYIQLVIYIT